MTKARVRPIIFFRVGYMATYDGVGEITGGGSHIDEQGSGGEMWNFQSQRGQCRGYVMSTRFSGVDLKKVSPLNRWKVGDALDGVDIVYFSTRPGVGQVIIGWYKNARIYHRKYRESTNPFSKDQRWHKSDYLCETSSDNAFLLIENDRTFEVPRARTGFSGQSNVWYADSELEEVKEYVVKVRRYINRSPLVAVNSSEQNGSSGWLSAPDLDLITRVEAVAVKITRSHFEAIGYEVESVEMDCRGWDLEARRGDEIIYLEVKGHVGDVVKFELTPNEYTQMKARSSAYKICVVLRALDNPSLSIFSPKKSKALWTLIADSGCRVELRESVAARAVEMR